MNIDYKNIDETMLLRLCQEQLPNTDDAFNEVFRRYGDYVFNVSLKILKNKDDALDISQEAFIRFYNNINSIRGESNIKTWMHRVTVNLSLSLILSNKRQNYKIMLDKTQEIDIDRILASRYEDNYDFDIWETIKEILSKMKESYKQVFVLRFLKGFSIQRISSIINSTINATKMKISRSKVYFMNIFMKGNYEK